MKKIKQTSEENFKKLRYTEYILAYTAFFMCIVLPIILSMINAGITSMWISDVILMTGILMAVAAAGIAVFLRYNKGDTYAVSTLCAFLLFSFVYQVMPHVTTFILTLAALCISVFILTIGAYNARREKGKMVTYICTSLICGVWFLASCV